MGGDDADGLFCHQVFNQTNRSRPFVVGVCTPQYFVQNNKSLVVFVEFCNDLLQSFEFGKEKGFVVLQRIAHPHTHENVDGIKRKLGSAHGQTHLRHDKIDAQSPQKGTLARHI